MRRVVLRLFVLEDADRGGVVYRVDQAWGQNITWNTQPTPGEYVGELGEAITRRTLEVDLTSAVQSDGSVSITIVPNSKQDVEYAASENDKEPGPVLLVER